MDIKAQEQYAQEVASFKHEYYLNAELTPLRKFIEKVSDKNPNDIDVTGWMRDQYTILKLDETYKYGF